MSDVFHCRSVSIPIFYRSTPPIDRVAALASHRIERVRQSTWESRYRYGGSESGASCRSQTSKSGGHVGAYIGLCRTASRVGHAGAPAGLDLLCFRAGIVCALLLLASGIEPNPGPGPGTPTLYCLQPTTSSRLSADSPQQTTRL